MELLVSDWSAASLAATRRSRQWAITRNARRCAATTGLFLSDLLPAPEGSSSTWRGRPPADHVGHKQPLLIPAFVSQRPSVAVPPITPISNSADWGPDF